MDKDLKDLKVYIFYSSKTEPEILSVYEEDLTKLRDKNIDYEVIDVTQKKEKAKKYGIRSTPAICLEKDGELEKKYEAIAHIEGILGLALIGTRGHSKSDTY